MKLRNGFIQSLVEDENPVHIIGSELLNIWFKSAQSNNQISNFYYQGEDEAKAFEEFIFKAYGDFYKNLARKCINESPLQKYGDASFIVMDGMSLREGVLIYNILKKDYEVLLSFSFSAIPSDTLPFREIKVSISNFQEINDPKNIRVSGDEIYIWSYFPDVMLDKIQVGHTVISSLEQMYETSEKIVKELINKLNADKMIILSDHGYIRSEAGFVFSMPANIKTKLQNIFGSKRYISMNDVDDNEIVKVNGLIKEGYVEEFAGYYLVKSRYVWPVKGRFSIYLHGGLSLMECFTPLIEVKK